MSPRLAEFEMTSVYYAATRFEAQHCSTDPVAVVGGGNSAGQAAIFLARSRPTSTWSCADDDLGRDMSRYLVDQIEANPRIHVLLHTEVRELIGEHTLEKVVGREQLDRRADRTPHACRVRVHRRSTVHGVARRHDHA